MSAKKEMLNIHLSGPKWQLLIFVSSNSCPDKAGYSVTFLDLRERHKVNGLVEVE